MTKPDPDRVEKMIELRAPVERVWRAISSPREFGTWFGLGDYLELHGDFVPGGSITGSWRKGEREVREHFCTVEAVEPQRLLVFRWVPYELPEGEDHAKHPTTRIEFRLEPIGIGTRLTISESGFAALPADKQHKRDENGEGWTVQLQSIAQHVLGNVTVAVEDRIGRPLADVFEAIVDPAKMAQYFISRGSARMTAGSQVEWEWQDVGAKQTIRIHEVEPDRISFVWSATGWPTKVTLALARDGAHTKITATETPFALTEEAVERALGQTQGWTDFCCCLKAYLQHGINLRRGKPADHVA